MAYDVKFLKGTAAQYSAASKDATTFYFVDNAKLYLGEKELTNSAVETAIEVIKTQLGEDEDASRSLEATVKAIETTVTKLDGDDSVTGSVKQLIKALKESLDVKVAATAVSDESGDVNVLTGFEIEDGALKAGSVTEQKLKKVATTGAAEDVAIKDAGNLIAASDVEGALQEIAKAIEDANKAGEVTVVEGAAAGDVLKSYAFYQGVLEDDDDAAKAKKLITTINIPKDYLVKKAEVKTAAADDEIPGIKAGEKYIDFTVNTKDGEGTGTAQHLYIAVNDLVHPLSGSIGTEVTVAVDENNQISATINKIAASKIVYKEAEGEDAEVTVKDALDTLNGAATVEGSVKKALADAKAYTDTEVQKLNADLDAETSATETDAEKVAVVSGVTEVNGKLTAVDSVDVDKAGAATRAKEAVIGKATDDKDADTIKGVKKLIGTLPAKVGEENVSDVIDYIDKKTGDGVNSLDVDEFALTTDTNDVISIYGIKEEDGKIAKGTNKIDLAKVAKTGKAENVAIKDDTKTAIDGSAADVDAALAALAKALTWGSIA